MLDKKVISFVVVSFFATCLQASCYKLDASESVVLKIDEAKKKQFISVKSSYGEDSFYCHTEKKGKLNCSGDDDGGNYIIENLKSVKLDYMRLGAPQRKKMKVIRAKDLKSTKLTKVKC